MAVEIKKKANVVLKDAGGDLVQILPSTSADNVSYGETTVQDVLDSLSSGVDSSASAVHSHGRITSDGRLGSDAGHPLITAANGEIVAGVFGTEEGTFAEGNDSRLSDAREPLPHTHSSADITSLDGYQKAVSAGAITSSDTVNSAFGKIEKTLEDLQSASSTETEAYDDDADLEADLPNGTKTIYLSEGCSVTLPYFTYPDDPQTSFLLKNTGEEDVAVVPADSNVLIDGVSETITLKQGEYILLSPQEDSGSYAVVSDGRFKEHTHIIAEVTTLQTELDGKNPLMDEITREEILNLLNT